MPMQGSPKLITLVIPVFNEEEVVCHLLERLREVTTGLPRFDWELILVDDGSSDGTVAAIQAHRALFPGVVTLIEFSRNFGHQPALAAGLSRAAGDATICLDADLQDPPALIETFLTRFEEGYEVVYAVRRTRREGRIRQLFYKTFYRIFRLLSTVSIPLDAGDFGLMSRRVVSLVVAMNDRDLFLRGLRSWVGFRQMGVPYDRPARACGETKYSLAKLWRLAASAFFGFSTLPLRIATFCGAVALLFSIAYFGFALYAKLFLPATPPGWTSLVAVILLLSGAQLVSVGILGEYIGRIYTQTLARPLFVIHQERKL